MALGACGKLSKWILLILNTVLLLVGLAMSTLGLWLRLDTKGFFEIAQLNTSAFVVVVTVLITLGSVLLGVVVFGGVSAYKENRCALHLFAVLLALLAGSVVVLGVLTYFKRDEVAAEMLEFYSTTYVLYILNEDKDPALTVTLTLLHRVFRCCGLMNDGPLIEVTQTCPKPSGIWEIVPACPAAIASAIESKAPVVMVIFLGAGALLLTALMCTVILIRKIRKGPREAPW